MNCSTVCRMLFNQCQWIPFELCLSLQSSMHNGYTDAALFVQSSLGIIIITALVDLLIQKFYNDSHFAPQN